MYARFFGLDELPFAITPDPRYLFMSARHAEALAHLVYGLREAGGFIQLTGEVGTGKTTLVRSMLARTPRDVEVALILNPCLTVPEFLQTICEELGIALPEAANGSVKRLVDALNSHLLHANARGKRVAVLIDEAHLLSRELLEQVRLLTNLETATRKLLQIILVGQPELRDVLAQHELRPLAQRITGRYHLGSLTRDETAAYVRHRLRVAGAMREVFSAAALRELHRLSGGVPRLVNVLGDRAMLGAFAADRHVVPVSLVRQAAREVSGEEMRDPRVRRAAIAVTVAVCLAGAFAAWRLLAVP